MRGTHRGLKKDNSASVGGALALAALALASITGCAGPDGGPVAVAGASRSGALVGSEGADAPWSGGAAGRTSAGHMMTPAVAGELGAELATWDLPEYSRRDAALSSRPTRAMLASARWPEEPRPSLGRQRVIWIETNPRVGVYYELEGRYWDRAWWPR